MMDMDDSAIQEAASRLLTSLAQGQGVDDEAAVALKAALRTAARDWRGQQFVPRSTASLFVDLFTSIDNSVHDYGPEKADKIQELAYEIGDLVRDVVA